MSLLPRRLELKFQILLGLSLTFTPLSFSPSTLFYFRELIIHKLQDADSNDLDLEYIVGDVFSDKATDKDSSIVRVIRLPPNRRSPIQSESALRPQRKHGRQQSLIGLPGRRPRHFPNSFTPRSELVEDEFDDMQSSGSLQERECKRHKVYMLIVINSNRYQLLTVHNR